MSKKTSKSDPFLERESTKYERPIQSREFILSHLKQRKIPANFKELVEDFKLEDEELQIALHRRIKAMLRDQQLERLKGGYFWPSGHRILIKGKVLFEKGKKAKSWVIPEDGSARILLIPNETHQIYNGNRVVVSVVNIKMTIPNFVREGHLVEILEQQKMIATGRFVKESGVSYVIPHGKEITQDVLIPKGQEHDKGAQDGDIVVVEIKAEPTRLAEPLGRVLEILGHEDAPGIEILSATRAYNLPDQWSNDVLTDIAQFSETIPNEAKKNRLDLRHLPLVTIDGEDAKDFDDAVYCEQKSHGGWQLYVAIADVSHYVKPNSALDESAKLRGTSVYFPGKVIPMLPEILSNGLCSLKPEVERLCVVCVMNVSKSGKLTRYEFHNAVMQSAARLTYTKVAALLEGSSDHLKVQYATLLPHLNNLHQLYLTLKLQREERGAIDFETTETRIIFGKNGKISRIEPIFRNEAHRLIEECMLLANVATAKFLRKHKLPGLYRIHEGPPQEKLLDLKMFLQELGLSLGGGKEPKSLDYAKLLKSIQHRKDMNVIQTVLLRSLSQAIYSPDNVGHFGLAYPEYCHFTSPIRRYPDLLIHRQIKTILEGKWTPKAQELAKSAEAKEELLALGDHSSMTERRADDATRDAVRWLKCEYIQKHIGDTYEGIISGVTRFGFFVELKDIYIDGLVHITSLRNDYYFYDAIHHRLVGERTGIIYKLGDSVQVSVAKVDVHERKIDFELEGISQKFKKAKGQNKSQNKAQKKWQQNNKQSNKQNQGDIKGNIKSEKQQSGKPRREKSKQKPKQKHEVKKSSDLDKNNNKQSKKSKKRKKNKNKKDKSE